MSRPDISDELDAVTRHLVLLAALVESLARSVRSPQDGPGAEADVAVVPGRWRRPTGKGNAAARLRTRTLADLPTTSKKRMDMDAGGRP